MRTRRGRWILLVIGLVLPFGCAGPDPRPVTSWEGESARVTLSYRHGARAVFAAGDFNGWEAERHPFRRDGSGHWVLELELPPGEHAYLLAIETDESWEWRTDPANPLRTRDAAGRELSLLRVAAPGTKPGS